MSPSLTHSNSLTDTRLSILIADKLWYKPSLISFFFMHADCSGQ